MAETVRIITAPFGTLHLTARAGRLAGIVILASGDGSSSAIRASAAPAGSDSAVLERAARELAEYVAGRRRRFEIPLDLAALPPFTRRVLEVLKEVPYGTTVTYGELARRAGAPGAARAVGRAMAVNPVPIVVPCHRVVAAGGRPGGYSGGGGLRTKEWLLALERRSHSGN